MPPPTKLCKHIMPRCRTAALPRIRLRLPRLPCGYLSPVHRKSGLCQVHPLISIVYQATCSLCLLESSTHIVGCSSCVQQGPSASAPPVSFVIEPLRRSSVSAATTTNCRVSIPLPRAILMASRSYELQGILVFSFSYLTKIGIIIE